MSLQFLQKIKDTKKWSLLMPCLVMASLSHMVEPSCHHRRPFMGGFQRDGDVLIGATFPVHYQSVQQKVTFTEEPAQIMCWKFSFRYYRMVRVLAFAEEEINRSVHILPNITLGFEIFDSCAVLQRALQGSFWMLTGQGMLVPNYQCRRSSRMAAVIGDSGSTRSISMAQLLGLYRLPQISYFATSPILSDRNQFPSFFRTVPSDRYQFLGLAQFLGHFGWTWVGILAIDNDYGQEAMRTLKQEFGKMGICAAFSETVPTSRADRDAAHVVEVIRKSTANVILVFLTEVDMVILLDEMVHQEVAGKTWIASEAWSTSALLSVKKYSRVLVGTIGFAIQSGEILGFEQFLNSLHPTTDKDDIFVGEFWEETFGCKWAGQTANIGSMEKGMNVCTGMEKLSEVHSMYNDVTNLRITFGVYNAVYAIALALQAMLSCRSGEGPFLNGTCADPLDFQPWQLLHYFKKVHFKTRMDTDVSFDSNGNPQGRYDIVNWQLDSGGNIRHLKVGRYDISALTNKHLLLNESAIRWAATKEMQVPASVCGPSCASGYRKSAVPEAPACCYMCVPCAPGEVSNQTDSPECFICPWDQWPNAHQDACIFKSEEFLSYQDPLGATLASISMCLSLCPCCILALLIQHRNTPIVRANNRSLSYLLLLCLTLCFLSSLAFIGYPTQQKCLLRQGAFGVIFALCISCIFSKTVMVVIAFKATKPNSDMRRWVGPQRSYMIVSVCTLTQVLLCVCWLIASPPFSEYNAYAKPGTIIVECNEGSPIAFWCMLGYLGLLAAISFLIAFLARKLPDSFNEAKYITFSMLAFLSVWLAFIPAYLSTRGKYMVAMEIFSILSSAAALLSCIFFPKCYSILLRPETNTRKHLLGRKIVTMATTE